MLNRRTLLKSCGIIPLCFLPQIKRLSQPKQYITINIEKILRKYNFDVKEYNNPQIGYREYYNKPNTNLIRTPINIIDEVNDKKEFLIPLYSYSYDIDKLTNQVYNLYFCKPINQLLLQDLDKDLYNILHYGEYGKYRKIYLPRKSPIIVFKLHNNRYISDKIGLLIDHEKHRTSFTENI